MLKTEENRSGNAAPEPSWETHPAATELAETSLARWVKQNRFLQSFSQRLAEETGTRLFDWVDRMTAVSASTEMLEQLGFARFLGNARQTEKASAGLWRHQKALLPDFVLPSSASPMIAIRVDNVIQFLQAQQLDQRCNVIGAPHSNLRRALVSIDGGVEVWAVERHGNWGWAGSDSRVANSEPLERHRQAFRLRQRQFFRLEDGFANTDRLIDAAIEDLGRDRACDEFFAAEREYWQLRNSAAQMQKMRQDRLGLGWSNHDHHTYRSSRAAFALLISSLEKLGFQCRERFYAGRQAGWGAQVLEQPECRIVIFADVDLGPEEVLGDFAHQPLPPREQLGTVGLWCELHGEAWLDAGMHHLECQFDFEAAREQLTELGSPSMKPFTDFDYLKQSFTVGERWKVPEERLVRAVNAGWITADQAAQFRTEGALGSHLEILERRHGYKGFNATGISEIIKDTDPRIN